MAPGGSPVRVDRVVAVAATLRDGREQLGSGYLVSGLLVLTAEHCSRDKVTGEPAAQLRVVRASDGAEAQVVGVVPDRGLDVAVLRLADNAPWRADLRSPVFARVDQSQAGVLEDCTGIGFPLFQRDPDRHRHTAEFHGTVYQTDERESGHLLMRDPLIHPGPVTDSQGQALSVRGGEGSSPWGGLSGALMFYRGHAIGVVVEHHPRQGDNALRATGFEKIAMTSAKIRECLGLPQPDSLPCVSEHVTVQLAPVGGTLVSEADPRRLGVHAAISVPGVPDGIPPEYIPRDVDAAESGIRAKVAAAARRGGFVLLVGGSSVGKTRSAVEAVKALLPDWWLVHPAGPGDVSALAAAPPPQTVIWLDEIQRYLDGEHGLTGGVVRALLGAPQPAVIIGTLWPDLYSAYTTMPVSANADPHARERQVLDLADVIRIGPAFSPAEKDRARAAATRDRRLAVALGAAGYGLTQTLAAAPQLVARWEDAQTADPYAWAVLTAALDAVRLGARAPLSADLLHVAAPSYLTSQQQAEAPGNWFEQALAYATVKLHGAAAALSPAGSGMGQVAGYTVADYLLQHASRERRASRVPARSWDAILNHIQDPADAARLADSARARLLYRYAIPLYRYAADAGDEHAALELANLLEKRGDLDEATQILRDRAEAGDGDAAGQLVRLLTEHGDLEGLRARADAGDPSAAGRLAELLAERGDLDGATQILGPRANAGNEYAAKQLADLLVDHSDLEGLRAQAHAGNWYAAWRLADYFDDYGDPDELVQILRALAHAGDRDAARQLADLLEKLGDLDEAEQILRALADAGDRYAAGRLADLLEKRGHLDEATQILRSLADADDEDATEQLVRRLAQRGDLDGAAQILRARADAGDGDAARQLVRLLAEHGDLEGLRARADAGDEYAARQVADLLEKRGHLDEATQILRARAEAGDGDAAGQLVRLLAEHRDLEGLRARANAGDKYAAGQLVRLLAEARSPG